MNNKWLVGLVVLAAVGVGGWYVLKGQGGYSMTAPATTPAESMEKETATGASGMEKGGVAERTVVTYTDNGFAPVPVTVKVGSTVTFVNESTGPMWVASALHPTHLELPGFDQLSSNDNGGTYEYTFTKVGTWKYHNHVNPSKYGSVVVTE